MRRSVLLTLGLLGCLPACDTVTGPNIEPGEQFGAATALINGVAWRSTPFQDSIIAFCDSTRTFLQIQALGPGPGVAPALQLILHAPIEVRGYRLDAIGGPSRGEWYRPAPQRVRPTQASMNAFISSGATADSLVITELDLPGHRIRGRFAFVGVELNGNQRVTISGHFIGRLAVVAPTNGAPRP